MSALDTMVGGNHYKVAIQPIEFIHKNGIPFIEGNCIKYLVRHRQKGGAQDIKKVIHYCQLLLELEYGEGVQQHDATPDTGNPGGGV